MAKRKLEIILTGVDKSATKSLRGVGKESDSLADKVSGIGKKMTIGITAPLVGLGGAAFKFSSDFNSAMANVGTLIPGNVGRVNELKTSVQDMAVEVGKSTSDLADGLYQTISAFGDTADTAEILRINAKAAAGGLASTTDSINLTSGVTKAYGDTSATAVAKVSDLALMTVRLGQTTFPELASAMGKVTPIAQSMGQSQEELFATFATLTGVTGTAAEVTTQYRGILAALMNPTAGLSKLLEEQGIASGQAALDQLGLVGTMQLIAGASESSGKPITDYISSIEAVPAALALAGPQADTYAEKLASMGQAAGTTDVAFKEQTEGVNKAGFAWEQAKAKGEVLLQRLGDGLAPALSSVSDALGPVVDWVGRMATKFSEADPFTQKVVLGLVAVVAATGPVLSVTNKVIGAWNGMVSAGSKVLSAGKAVHGGLGRVAGGFRDARVAESQFSGRLGTLGGKLKSGVSAIGTGAKSFASWGKEATIAAAKTVAHTTATVASKAAALAVAGAQKAWAAAQWALNAAMSANPIGLIVAAIAALVAAAVWAYQNVDWFRTGVDAAFSGIRTVVEWAWQGIQWVFDNWQIAISVLMGPIGLLAALVISHWDKISGAAQWAWNSVLSPIFNGIGWVIGNVVIPYFEAMWSVAQRVWGGVTSIISGAWNTINWVFGAIAGGIRWVSDRFWDIRNGIAGAVGGIADILWGPFKTAFNWIARGWNDTVGRLSFSIPGWVPGIGGKGFSMPRLPTYHTGGIFRSMEPGGEGLALLRDGEQVVTPGHIEPGGGTSQTVVVYETNVIEVAGHILSEDNLLELIRSGFIRKARTTPGIYLPGVTG